MDNRTQNQAGSAAENQNRQGERQEMDNPQATPHHTQIDNAHASGLGAMGRNDEKLPNDEDGEEWEEEPGY